MIAVNKWVLWDLILLRTMGDEDVPTRTKNVLSDKHAVIWCSAASSIPNYVLNLSSRIPWLTESNVTDISRPISATLESASTWRYILSNQWYSWVSINMAVYYVQSVPHLSQHQYGGISLPISATVESASTWRYISSNQCHSWVRINMAVYLVAWPVSWLKWTVVWRFCNNCFFRRIHMLLFPFYSNSHSKIFEIVVRFVIGRNSCSLCVQAWLFDSCSLCVQA